MLLISGDDIFGSNLNHTGGTDEQKSTNHHATLGLDAVKQQFKAWRSNRSGRERIPVSLWQAAIAIVLAGGFSLNKVARELSLSHSDLKHNVYKQSSGSIQPVSEPSPSFIEIEPLTSFPECVIEMKDGSGIKMRMCFRGKADSELIELGKYFLRGQA